MLTPMTKKFAPYVEYFAESTTACLVTMVQGNFLAIGLSHVFIASQTGIAAGTIAYVALLFAKAGKQWVISITLGVATGVVDFFVHPGMFGTAATEAIVTGLGAAVLSFLVGTAIRRLREKSGVGV